MLHGLVFISPVIRVHSCVMCGGQWLCSIIRCARWLHPLRFVAPLKVLCDHEIDLLRCNPAYHVGERVCDQTLQ